MNLVQGAIFADHLRLETNGGKLNGTLPLRVIQWMRFHVKSDAQTVASLLIVPIYKEVSIVK